MARTPQQAQLLGRSLDPSVLAATSPVQDRPAVVGGPAAQSARDTGRPSPPAPAPSPKTLRHDRRGLLAGPLIAVVSMGAAVLTTEAAGIGVRDPDHVAGRRLLIVFAVVLGLVAFDVLLRAMRNSARRWPSLDELRAVRRERWTRERGIPVAVALTSFYITYLAYRNMKSVVPLLRPGDLFDGQLAGVDRVLFLGHDPAQLMHTLLGTGLATHVLSSSYLLFFAFIPGTLALALVFSPNLQAGLFYAAAQGLNWLLGAASYFAIPALGPVYADPATFSGLPRTSVSQLQDLLLTQRTDFIAQAAAGGAQSIAAFSSLHISIFFTGALAAHLLGLSRRWKVAAWGMLTLTAGATIFLGWHYVVDDLAGFALGALALLGAHWITGFDPRRPAAEALAPPRRPAAEALAP